MIVVTTPSGHIGSQLVPHLLVAGAPVRVIARKPEKLSAEIQSRVEIVQGSTDDINVLFRAFKDVEAVFWLVPPPLQQADLDAYFRQFSGPVCAALTEQSVKRVVAVSSLGCNLTKSLFPVFAMDQAIQRTGVSFRALWCPGFMENMLRHVPAIKREGLLFGPDRADLKIPLVAKCDAAASAARLLLDDSWVGQGGLAVLGPEDLSFNDRAEIMSDSIGKPIRFQQIPRDVYKRQLIESGVSESLAQGLVDLSADVHERGVYHAEPRSPENTTPTTFRMWCDRVLRPAVLGDVAA